MMTYGVFFLLLAILIVGLLLVLGSSWDRRRSSSQGMNETDDPPRFVSQGHICTQCGHVQNQRAQYCGHCGARLDD